MKLGYKIAIVSIPVLLLAMIGGFVAFLLISGRLESSKIWPIGLGETYREKYAEACSLAVCAEMAMINVKMESVITKNFSSCVWKSSTEWLGDKDVTKAMAYAQLAHVGQIGWQPAQTEIDVRKALFCNGICKFRGLGTYLYEFYRLHYYFGKLAEKIDKTKMYFIQPFNPESPIYHNIVVPVGVSVMSITLNYVNLKTIGMVMKDQKDSGSSLYYHQAEIITDLMLTLLSALKATRLVDETRRFFKGCFSHFSFGWNSNYALLDILDQPLMLLNQLILVELVNDRLECFTKVFEYHKRQHKKYSRKRMKTKLIISSLIATPYAMSVGFGTIVRHWFNLGLDMVGISRYMYGMPFRSIGFSTALDHTFRCLINLTICVLLVMQAYLSFKLARVVKKRTPVKSATNAGTAEFKEKKKAERKKMALLWGTICINLVTVSMTAFVETMESMGMLVQYYLIAFNPVFFSTGFMQEKMTRSFFTMITSTIPRATKIVTPWLLLLNGNGAVLIHVLTCRSYRKAFGKTKAGKVLMKMKNRIAPKVGGEQSTLFVKSQTRPTNRSAAGANVNLAEQAGQQQVVGVEVHEIN